jgi:hypothetical protein
MKKLKSGQGPTKGCTGIIIVVVVIMMIIMYPLKG